jgi:hypothetical protein
MCSCSCCACSVAGGTSRTRPGGAALLVLAFGALLLAGCGSSSKSAHRPKPVSTSTTAAPPAAGQPGPERIPLEAGPVLAPASSTAPGITVDGIQCAPIEQLAYHIHVHLQVYVQGHPRALPGAIGLLGPMAQQTPVGPFYGADRCYYWLHTHTSDGVIHIESPTPRTYTLGNFFDEWGQPLGPNQVASAHGKVTAFVNGRLWTKPPNEISLVRHAVIQLDVGSPVTAFQPMSWAGTVL